jgi:hypothetical protein
MGNQSGRLIIIGEDATPNQILVAASDFLERWGWTQGQLGGGRKFNTLDPLNLWRTEFHPACASGAINAVIQRVEPTKRYAIRETAYKLLRSRLGGRSIIDWNDSNSRTAEQVIAKMREAAGIHGE